MSRITTPSSIEASPASSRPMIEAVKKQLGVVAKTEIYFPVVSPMS